MKELNITLKQIQEIKQRAEKEILTIVKGIELSTQCIVSDIDVYATLNEDTKGNDINVRVSLEIKDTQDL